MLLYSMQDNGIHYGKLHGQGDKNCDLFKGNVPASALEGHRKTRMASVSAEM